MERARRFCRRLFHRVYHPYALRQIAKPVTRLRGRTLLTDPEVFHPVYFLSTPLFVDYLSTVAVAGKRLLDMGTGSGTIGIFAASRGAQVTACDINPRAVALAGVNARRNDVEMEVLSSDLFSALAGRSFDLICFNLPFYAGVPRSVFEHALYGGTNFETIRTFADGCRRALAPCGTVAVIFSEDSGPDRMISLFTHAGFVATDHRTARRYLERFHLMRLQLLPSATPAEQHG
jgi:release factor glutamine methyltransferase